MPTISNSGSGEWTAKATWQGGVVPTAADDVFLDFSDPSRPDLSFVVDLNTEHTAAQDLMILAKNEFSIGLGASLALESLTISDGTLGGYGAQIEVSKTVQNNGTIMSTIGELEFDGSGTLFNTGTLSAAGSGNALGSTLEIVNSGLVEATDGGSMVLSIRNNTGVITASGPGSIIQSDSLINAGTLRSVDGALFMLGDTTNGQGGALIIDGGALQITGAVTGGTVTIMSNGAFFYVGVAAEHSTAEVLFSGPGMFSLDPSAGYEGTIEGFGVGVQIDVGDVAFVAGKNKFNPATGLLTIDDGHHTTTLQLAGSYAADDFEFRPDMDGSGTLVSFNRQGSTAPQTIDQADLQVASLYLGYFGRAGDPAGQAYWHDQLAAGSPGALASVAASFAVQAEAKAAYPLLADPHQATPAVIASFIDQVYENLFGRDPDAAGAAYWQNELAASVATTGVGSFVLNVISGAQAGDAATLAHRAEVVAFFTDHLAIVQLAYGDAADLLARDVIDAVTADDATVAAAKTAMSTFIDNAQLLEFVGIASK